MLRLAGGSAGGRRLKGAITPGTRATTERVRAAIFNILNPEVYAGRRALDLFAGSGSLGLEALSRGAAWADFIERDRRQCAVIAENLQVTGFAGCAAVRRADALRCLPHLPGGYHLALLDPPYAMPQPERALQAIADASGGLLAPGAIVVMGHSRHTELAPAYGPLSRTETRRYGDNVVAFYRNSGGNASPPPPPSGAGDDAESAAANSEETGGDAEW